MSFGREVKDFISAFGSMRQLQQGQAKSDYYNARAKALKASTFDPEAAGDEYDRKGPGAIDTGDDHDHAGGTINHASIATYGDPRQPDWAKNNIVTVEAPNGVKFQVHKSSADDYKGFLKELSDTGYEIKDGGGHNVRNIAGTNKLSQHAFGNAIDINPGPNARGGKGNLPDNINDIASKYNLTWGGNWKNTDPMHFEWHPPANTNTAAPSNNIPTPPVRPAAPTSAGEPYRVGALDDTDASPDGVQLEQLAATGGMIRPVASYETAGPVDDYDPDIDSGPDELDQMQAQHASASEAEGDGGGGGDDSTLLGKALHGGMTFMQSHFGLGQQNAAVGNDPQRAQAQRRFMQGEGAMDPHEYAAASRAVDPRGKLNDAQRNIYILEKMYDFHLRRGDPASADKAAAALIQYTSNQAAKYGQAAVEAGKRGDLKGMVDNAKKGYEFTPDGHDADAEIRPDGNIEITRKDAKTGEPNGSMTVTPQQLFNAAVGLSNKSSYWDSLMEAGSRYNATRPGARNLAMQRATGLIEQFRAAGGEPDKPQGAPAQAAPAQGAKPQGAVPASVDGDGGGDPAPAPTASVPAAPTPGGNLPTFARGDVPPAVTSSQAPAVSDQDTTEGSGAGEESVVSPSGTASAAPQGAVPTSPNYPQLQRPSVPPFESIAPRPEMNAQQRQIIQQLTAINPSAARALEAEWKQNVLAPWLQQKQDYMKEAQRKADLIYQQSREDRRVSVSEAGANRRQTFQEEQANKRQTFQEQQANKRSQFQEDQANKRTQAQQEHDMRLQQERENHDKRMEYYKNSKPVSVNDLMKKDENQDEFFGRINGAIMNNILSTYRDDQGKPLTQDGKPIDENWVKQRIGSQALQALRDTTIDVMRYNGNLSHDTAAAVALQMTYPGRTGDEVTPYKTSPVPSVPGDTDDRVLVKFRGDNPALRSVVLPAEAVQRMDMIRGQRTKKDVTDIFNQMISGEKELKRKEDLAAATKNVKDRDEYYKSIRGNAVVPSDAELKLVPKQGALDINNGKSFPRLPF
jgi:hypothetical protein